VPAGPLAPSDPPGRERAWDPANRMTSGATAGWYRAGVDALIVDDAARPGASERTVAPGAADRPADRLTAHWLDRVDYRATWDLQRALAAARADGRIGDQLLLLEHPPVLTLGRHADERHVLAPAALLAERGIEVVRVERGGEVTYHGPGQLVAYPILELSRRGLLLRPLVRALEGAMADACAAFGVEAGRRDGHPGCWCDPDGPIPRKVGALGIRVERGVSFHGIALNVAPDLRDFTLIDPCGMPGLTSTSIEAELARASRRPGIIGPAAPADTGERGAVPRRVPSVADVAAVLARALAARLGSPLEGALPPDADPSAERLALARLAEG
jgi:lipoyl(octanoyl) transferase